MTRHQHTRTTFGPTSGEPIDISVTLAGPCFAMPCTKPKWTRPVEPEPVYRTIPKTKIAISEPVKFDVMNFKPKSMFDQVKAEQATQAFTSRWHFQYGVNIPAQKAAERQEKIKAVILAVMVGEMPAADISALIDMNGVSPNVVAAMLTTLVKDGLVIRRYDVSRRGENRRQIGMYTKVGA